jgi:hypothetical protein
MKLPAHKSSTAIAFTRRAALCLLLAILFLYNPFLMVADVSGTVHVHHPLSYRATVASGELRSCTIHPTVPQADAVDALTTWEQIHRAALSRYVISPAPAQEDFTVAIERVVLESVWFRPPPVV